MSTDLNYRTSSLDDGTSLVTLGGELDIVTAGAELEELLEECAENACHVVIDMSQITYIDSSGLGLLVRADKRLCVAGRQLVILRPHPSVRRILEITGLDRHFRVAESWPVDDALLSE